MPEIGVDVCHFSRGGNRLSDHHRAAEIEFLADIERVAAGNSHSDKIGKERRQEHAMHDTAPEFRAAGVLLVDV